MNDDLLEVLQADIAAILLATPSLALCNILLDNEGDIEARVAKSLQSVAGRGGKMGLSAVVLFPDVREADENLPGPPLEIDIEVQVLEYPLINRSPAGTGIRSSQAALCILSALSNHQLGGQSLYAAPNPISPVAVKTGYVSHAVKMRCRANGLQGPGKPAAVVAEIVPFVTAERLLTISGTDPAIPNLMQAGTRYGQTLYTEDGTDTNGQPSCYYDGTRWVIWLAFDHAWESDPTSVTSPDLAPGWEPVAATLGEGLPIITSSPTSFRVVAPGLDQILIADGTGGFSSNGQVMPPAVGAWARASSTTSWSVESWLNEDFLQAWQSPGEGLEATPDLAEWPPEITVTEATVETLSLTCATPGADIFYSIDGYYPTPNNGTIYTGLMELPEAGTTVRAAAYKEGLNPGDCLEFTITESN
jgi:hypothetical protein